MARYIDADALKEWMKKPTGFRTNCEDCTEIDCIDCIMSEVIDNAPTVTVPQWISVKDRMPENETKVLVCCKAVGTYKPINDTYIQTNHISSYNKLWDVSIPFGYEVTHWMPLPESPLEE